MDKNLRKGKKENLNEFIFVQLLGTIQLMKLEGFGKDFFKIIINLIIFPVS